MATDWDQAMRTAAALDLTTALDEPDEDFAAPVPWQRLSADGRRVDVQIMESALLGRKLLIVELDIGDDETERRILEAIGAGASAGGEIRTRAALGVGSRPHPQP